MTNTNQVRSYRDREIEFNFYGQEEFSVQYCGDDVMFKTIEEAKEFIDEILEKDC